MSELILSQLFSKYVTEDETSLSAKLYMNIDEIKAIIGDGMYVGGHGYHHHWLPGLPQEAQVEETEASLNLLRAVAAPVDSWVMNYPFGGYDDSLITILKKRDCKAALTKKRGIAQLTEKNAFTLERFDATDFPR